MVGALITVACLGQVKVTLWLLHPPLIDPYEQLASLEVPEALREQHCIALKRMHAMNVILIY
jgi:hypothetical protein